MPIKRWYHVSGNNICFGFAINQHYMVTDCGDGGFKVLYGKSVKDPAVRRGFTENFLTVSEIKINAAENLQQVQQG